MKLPRYVNVLPWPLNKTIRGMAFIDKVYLRKDIYKDLQSGDPRPENVGILIHEETHLTRLKEKNPILHGVKYWLSPRFRYTEELEADKQRLKYLKRKKGEFDFEERAKHLSGFVYLCCVSYQKALKDLKDIWNKV